MNYYTYNFGNTIKSKHYESFLIEKNIEPKDITEKYFGVIYLILNIKTQRIYIGQTVNFKKRMYDHKRNYETEKKYLYNSMKKYGLDCFIAFIIDYAETKEDLDNLEKHYIDIFNSTNKECGYNIAAGGGGTIGITQVRSKASGKILTVTVEEFKNNPDLVHVNSGKVNVISKLTGKKMKVTVGEYESNPDLEHINKNRFYSKESREKMSISHTGKKQPKSQVEKIKNTKLNKLFENNMLGDKTYDLDFIRENFIKDGHFLMRTYIKMSGKAVSSVGALRHSSEWIAAGISASQIPSVKRATQEDVDFEVNRILKVLKPNISEI